MSETGKEVKCSVYSKLKKTALSEEETEQRQSECTSTAHHAFF